MQALPGVGDPSGLASYRGGGTLEMSSISCRRYDPVRQPSCTYCYSSAIRLQASTAAVLLSAYV